MAYRGTEGGVRYIDGVLRDALTEKALIMGLNVNVCVPCIVVAMTVSNHVFSACRMCIYKIILYNM